MKRGFVLLLLFLISAGSCFAGIFYSNIVVFAVEKDDLETVLSELDLTAYYTIQDYQGVVYEKIIDTQDTFYGIELSKTLSEKLGAVTVYTTNHDSDVLLIYIFKNGGLLFSYNSNPGYFTGEYIPPEISRIDTLLNEFISVDKEALIWILTSEEIFAEDIHWNLFELLRLPFYTIGLGYDYLNYIEDDEIAEIEKEYGIQFKKIEK